MAAALHVWSLEVTPGEVTSFVPAADLRITNVALGEVIADEKSRTTVKLVYRRPGAGDDDDEDEEDEEDEKDEEEEPQISSTVLCSLTYGKIEQASVDLVLNEDEEYLIELVGKNTVYLSGNYIDQQGFDQPPFGDEDESEDDYDLRDVSSDVEIDPNELDIPSDGDAVRFEEIVDDEAAPVAVTKETSRKRPRESDTMETDEQEGKLKSQKKKLKKLKAANGEAAEAPSPEKKEERKEKKEKEKGDKKAKTVETKTVTGGVQVEEHKVGNGPAAKRGNRVTVRYIGKLTNGKIFDKNTNANSKPFSFRLGSGEVIKGWDVGIEGMHVGGERKITIPAPMGYGKKAQPGIPANSTLVFEVKMLSISSK